MPPSSSLLPEDEPGYALSALLIGVLAVLLVASMVAGPRLSHLVPGVADALGGVFLIALGAMFALSYRWSHKAFFLRALMWLCEHGSRPAGRFMAWFYAALCAFLGSMGIAKALGWLAYARHRPPGRGSLLSSG